MNRLSCFMALVLISVALVAAQDRQATVKDKIPYPNELPSLKLYEEAKWNSLKFYISTIDDVEKILGKPVAVYDDTLRTHVAGFEVDPDWTIVIGVVGEGGQLPESLAGRVMFIELRPRKRISVVGADFSAFRGATVTGRNEETTSYSDPFGLRYVVYEKDSPDGHHYAGDLKWIIYGPSEETTARFSQRK